MKFKNTYSHLPEHFFKRAKSETFPSPEILAFNENLALELGLDPRAYRNDELAQIFSGQKLLQGMEPLAQAYAGFQFGHPVSQLGDGRALLLGEVNGKDIQLKGSGRTFFSRNGDGRSALGPVLREYIVSEAMHALGVPTTRALAAVSTGESVMRQNGPEPGGIFTRVAESHLRVGTFQYFAFKQDFEAIKTLLDYTLQRHYPEISINLNLTQKIMNFIKALSDRQSELIAQWSSLGFIHGVMNTDNFSVAGITIDYGPCAFLDEFNYYKVFSSIDRNGRYAFYNQVPIAIWNIFRLAECFVPLIESEEELQVLESYLNSLNDIFAQKRTRALARKLGFENYVENEEEILKFFLDYLEKYELDFTLSFRNLPALYEGKTCDFPEDDMLRKFLTLWKEKKPKLNQLDLINPLYIPRNHQIERVIQAAYERNYIPFKEMLEVTKSPFQKNESLHFYSEAPERAQRVTKTFCGT